MTAAKAKPKRKAKPKKAAPALGAAGKRALAQANAVIDEQAAPAERFTEAAGRYARAVDLADRLNRHWAQEGRPLTTLGGATGRSAVPHPLIKMIAEAERDAARFGEQLGLDPQSRQKLGAGRGRPQERVPLRVANEPPKVVPFPKAG